MRDIEEVLGKIISILNGKDMGESDLVIELNCIINDSRYTAPELMYLRWQLAHESLCSHLLNEKGKITKGEYVKPILKIFSIFADKPVRELQFLVEEGE